MKKTLLTLVVFLVAASYLTLSAQENARFSKSSAPKEALTFSKDVTVIFSENFEEAVFPPIGWTTINTHPTANSNWHRATDAVAGNSFAEVLYEDDVLMNEWLISPSIDLTNATEITLGFSFFTSYYWLVNPYDGADLFVKISTDGGDSWSTLWTEEDYGTFTSYVWYQVTLPLEAYAGESNVKIAFQFLGDDGAQSRFDDIFISAAAAPATYTVTFTVTDGTDPIVGATIAINEEELTTDASGVATIDLLDGAYPYIVTKEGFVTVEGTATVAGEALAVAVEMEAEGPVTFPVTITVIDQKEIYTNIKFKGTPTGWANVAMVEEPTHTWTLTLQVEPGSHEWGAIEDDGSEYGIWLIEGSNRAFTLAADGTVTGQTSYTILAPGDKAVTFIVDISTLEGFDPEADFIDLAGSFTGWSGTDPFEVDAENANLYTWTTNADLRPGQILMFKFRLNGAWDPTEENPHQGAETPADPDGKLNRMFVVSAVEEENVYTAVWGENYTHNLGAVAALADIEVETGAIVADLNLPEMIEVELGVPSNLTGETVSLPVTWDTEEFSSAVAGEVMLHGEIALSYEDVTYFNGYALMAEVKVIITGTSVTTKPAFQLSVFPNPTSGDLNVVGGSQISSIRVMNMLGQQVMNVSNLGRENVTLSTSTLSAGIYIISVTDMNGATVTNRFVKR
jgi:hypothetical protein